MAFQHKDLLDLPTGRAAYSDRISWLMAECSALAYVKFEEGGQTRANLVENLREGRFELVETFNRRNTQGFLARRQKFAVLAFRGTEKNLGDILTDLNIRFYKHEETGARLARGFGDAYQHVAEEISRTMETVDVPLYITGHSLGGALATIASMKLPSDRIAACYTFGGPRVGNSEFEQKLYKVPVYRVVHAADIVPRVPLLVMGYRHTGDIRYITRIGTILRSPAQIRLLFRLISSVIRNWHTIFTDHRISAYCEKLAKWAKERQGK